MRGPLDTMRIRRCSLSHGFGMVRTDAKGNAKPHQGWDLSAPEGTPVYAITRGIVRGVVRDEKRGGDYGCQLLLEFEHHGQVHFAFYAHLSAVLVENGKGVAEGQVIGFTGRTGNARKLKARADEHLHFELRNWIEKPGKGLAGRIDPGEILGYAVYSCQ